MSRFFGGQKSILTSLILINQCNFVRTQVSADQFNAIPDNTQIGIACGLGIGALCCLVLLFRGTQNIAVAPIGAPPVPIIAPIPMQALQYTHHNSQTELNNSQIESLSRRP